MSGSVKVVTVRSGGAGGAPADRFVIFLLYAFINLRVRVVILQFINLITSESHTITTVIYSLTLTFFSLKLVLL